MTALAATRDTASDPGVPVAQRLEFENAAQLRDRIRELQEQELALRESDLERGPAG